MNWKKLESTSQLDQLKEESLEHPIVIFKHSTRCSISSMAINRLERSFGSYDDNPGGAPFYYLDLIRFRDVSDKIENDFGVMHQSPQILVINKGECIFDASHIAISFSEVVGVIDNLKVA